MNDDALLDPGSGFWQQLGGKVSESDHGLICLDTLHADQSNSGLLLSVRKETWPCCLISFILQAGPRAVRRTARG